VAQRAQKRGASKQEAVRQAVQAKLQRMTAAMPLRERIAARQTEHKLPPPTGQMADEPRLRNRLALKGRPLTLSCGATLMVPVDRKLTRATLDCRR
jgi:hypothetical protein